MNGRCVVCQDPRVSSINLVLLGGKSRYATAAAFGLSPWSMKRHVANGHLPRPLRDPSPVVAPPESSAQDDAAPGVPTGSTKSLRERLEKVMQKLEAMADDPTIGHRAYLETVVQLRLLSESLAKRGGDLPLRVDVLATDEWQQVVEVVVAVLDRHPAALADFRAELRRIAGQGTTSEGADA